MLGALWRGIGNAVFLMPFRRAAFRRENPGESILASGPSKLIVTDGDVPVRRGTDWVSATRGCFFLTDRRLLIGSWSLPLDQIVDARYVEGGLLPKALVLKFSTVEGRHYQLGVAHDPAWFEQQALPLARDDAGIAHSAFSILARLAVVVLIGHSLATGKFLPSDPSPSSGARDEIAGEASSDHKTTLVSPAPGRATPAKGERKWPEEQAVRVTEQVSYVLLSGERAHSEHPDSFPIPAAEARRGLKRGALVKLMFRIQTAQATRTERMWVAVSGKRGETYLGVLDNDPTTTTTIRSGLKVAFEARHVIQIWSDAVEGSLRTKAVEPAEKASRGSGK